MVCHSIQQCSDVVHRRIADEYFSESLNIMKRKLEGMQDSLVTSSVWRPDFKNALRAYPDLTLAQMEFSIPTCDACHIGGRISTIVGHLSGSRYSRETFQVSRSLCKKTSRPTRRRKSTTTATLDTMDDGTFPQHLSVQHQRRRRAGPLRHFLPNF